LQQLRDRELSVPVWHIAWTCKLIMYRVYTLCLNKNDTDVAHYNLNAH